ncbi:MAG: NADH-quinone oxidoreductase subunit NuoH [Candidatus Eremiobacteraeota bacterium]|nr:NADH-quinone oxidoreductase subunit NuoH [Candidatus Eremiobacteraeota bacterium]MCW5869493.1 NADH-quinone oxidoreductase subunit NuoH [Candidatus Eremiobacteraeota bacterium]
MTLEALGFFVGVVIKAVLFSVALLTGFAYMTYGERRIVARMQWRVGPNKVGPWGLLQPAADGIKLLFKEQLQPKEAKTFLFVLAPMISLVVALSAYAVIPIDKDPVNLFGYSIEPWVSNPSIAVLYLLGISSLGVYGIILGGWASNNKYALLGAIRSSAQVISYELALGTALVSPLLMVGSLSFRDVVNQQLDHSYLTGDGGWLILAQPVAFFLYWTAAVAEVNRAPFDLPEAEQELGAGYHTEYSGMKFAMFFMAEYVNMFTVSSVATTVFLGGPGGLPVDESQGLLFRLLAHGPHWFLLKVYFFMFVFIWLRATFPRFRYDQLMRIGWQFLLPLGLINLGVTAVGVAMQWKSYQFTLAVASMLVTLIALSMLNRKPEQPDHH